MEGEKAGKIIEPNPGFSCHGMPFLEGIGLPEHRLNPLVNFAWDGKSSARILHGYLRCSGMKWMKSFLNSLCCLVN